MPEHTAQQGECVLSLAAAHGLDWQAVWEHARNAQLRETRTPHVLYPGDVVYLPEREQRYEDGATEQRHKFVRKGGQAILRLCLLDDAWEPRRGVHYVLTIDGEAIEGDTDGEGKLEATIAPGARQAHLTIDEDGKRSEYDLPLGHIDPVTCVSGVQQRLMNLGFDCGGESDVGEHTRAALWAFQEKCGLQPSGNIDDATCSKLIEIHDGYPGGGSYPPPPPPPYPPPPPPYKPPPPPPPPYKPPPPPPPYKPPRWE